MQAEMLRIAGACFASRGKNYNFGWLSGYPGGTFQYRIPAWKSGTRVPEYPLRTLIQMPTLEQDSMGIELPYLNLVKIDEIQITFQCITNCLHSNLHIGIALT